MLLDFLLTANRESPARLAISDGRVSLTYRRLTRLAVVMADLARDRAGGDHVGIMLPASTAFPAVMFGALWAGKVAVPLNFLLKPNELEKVVRDAGLKLIVTVKHFKELADALPAEVVFLEDLPIKRRMILKSIMPLPRAPRVNPDDTAVLLYTSGTTGDPKGVPLSHGNLHSNCVDTIESLGLDGDQRFLNILPPFHVFGLTANILVPVAMQATVHAIPRFSPVAVLKGIAEHRITIIMAIPSMYAAMLKTKSPDRGTFGSVRQAMSGGEPLSASLRTSFQERFGVELFEGYGLTETSPVISLCTLSAHKAGTVGRPIPHVETRIVDENGQPAVPGADGELWVRGPGVMKGYYGKPEETAKVIVAGGWFTTGDIARIDEEGFLSITGRAKEMLIIGGENVFPREIETVLEDHADVVQAAVIGIPDESRGEAPVAFVTCREGATVRELELRNHAKQSLAGYKVPKRILIRDDLPTSPTGKILKRGLRDLLTPDGGR